MKFRLIYEGEIKPRKAANLADIHAIRQQLHPQIKRLWDHHPLSVLKERSLKETSPDDTHQDAIYDRIVTIAGKKYASIVGADLGAELDIVFLRQQAKGQLIGEGGDIDNRLKTLFDALRLPNTQEVQQLKDATLNDESPLHCLLKDDALIHRVNVETDRLLKDAAPRTIVAIIQVTIIITRMTFETIGLSGG